MPILLIVSLLAPMAVRADPAPTLSIDEIRKQRAARRAEKRDPKGFWVRQIVERIEERKYRLKAPLKETVKVEIGFVVGRDGQVKSKEVTKTSGLPAVDKVALALLDRAAPFPPDAPRTDRRDLELHATAQLSLTLAAGR